MFGASPAHHPPHLMHSFFLLAFEAGQVPTGPSHPCSPPSLPLHCLGRSNPVMPAHARLWVPRGDPRPCTHGLFLAACWHSRQSIRIPTRRITETTSTPRHVGTLKKVRVRCPPPRPAPRPRTCMHPHQGTRGASAVEQVRLLFSGTWTVRPRVRAPFPVERSCAIETLLAHPTKLYSIHNRPNARPAILARRHSMPGLGNTLYNNCQSRRKSGSAARLCIRVRVRVRAEAWVARSAVLV